MLKRPYSIHSFFINITKWLHGRYVQTINAMSVKAPIAKLIRKKPTDVS